MYSSLKRHLLKIREVSLDSTSRNIFLFYSIGSLIESYRLSMMLVESVEPLLFLKLFLACLMNVLAVPVAVFSSKFTFPWWVWLNLLVMWSGLIYLVGKATIYRTRSSVTGERRIIKTMFFNRVRSVYFLVAITPLAFYFDLAFAQAVKLWWLVDFWFF
ncbi:MAG: hypothetical protein SV760_03865, partial [Halobacteria archaeon]|nr:hypothetical protein [Halobacteria archaeon]